MNETPRHITRSRTRVITLAPAGVSVALKQTSKNCHTTYSHFLRQIQKLRGRIFVEDGAFREEQLTPDGRLEFAEDHRSWHMALVRPVEGVIGFFSFIPHIRIPKYEDLKISRTPLASDPFWKNRLRRAVETELNNLRMKGHVFYELGALGLATNFRGSFESLKLILGVYAMSQMIGPGNALSTSTIRNDTAALLRRIGAKGLEVESTKIPPYFDARFGCTMEILSFETGTYNRRYQRVFHQVERDIQASDLVTDETDRMDRVSPITQAGERHLCPA